MAFESLPCSCLSGYHLAQNGRQTGINYLWIFELKQDGFRGVAYVFEDQCKLVSRKNNAYKSFAPLQAAIARERVKDAILDGDIVCLDSDGRSLFKELLHRRGSPIFYAFDLLWLNGRDLRHLPLLERKRMLWDLIRG